MQSPRRSKMKPQGEAVLAAWVRSTSPGRLEIQPHHRLDIHPVTAPGALSKPRDLSWDMAEPEHWQDSPSRAPRWP